MKPVSSSLQTVGLVGTFLSLTSLIFPQTVQAQTLTSIDSGLFHPRSSEQFFQEGVEQFEAEVECLSDAERCGFASEAEDLLVVDEALQPPQDEPTPQEQWLLEWFQLQ